jgi:hypothetical protein
MAKVFRTSRGEAVDMDMLRLSNEQTIAIGNMRTNARGDELGKGGQVVKSKAQIMQEYHKLNTPMANNEPVRTSITQEQKPVKNTTAPVATNTPVASVSIDGHLLLRSTLNNGQVYMYSILDNPIGADVFNGTNTLDVLDLEFPCDESLFQTIVELTIKEIASLNGLPRDINNNANDDTSLIQNSKKN